MLDCFALRALLSDAFALSFDNLAVYAATRVASSEIARAATCIQSLICNIGFSMYYLDRRWSFKPNDAVPCLQDEGALCITEGVFLVGF